MRLARPPTDQGPARAAAPDSGRHRVVTYTLASSSAFAMRRIAANYYVRHFCIVSPAEGSVTAARRRCYGGASVGAGGPAGGLGPLETGDLIASTPSFFRWKSSTRATTTANSAPAPCCAR